MPVTRGTLHLLQEACVPGVAAGPGVPSLPAQALGSDLIGTLGGPVRFHHIEHRGMGGAPGAVRLGGGTAGSLCPESAHSAAVSPTWLCGPEPSDTAGVASFLLLEKTPTPSSTDSCHAV